MEVIDEEQIYKNALLIVAAALLGQEFTSMQVHTALQVINYSFIDIYARRNQAERVQEHIEDIDKPN